MDCGQETEQLNKLDYIVDVQKLAHFDVQTLLAEQVL